MNGYYISSQERAGMNQTAYCGHSFRIGAATRAVNRGMEDAKDIGTMEEPSLHGLCGEYLIDD